MVARPTFIFFGQSNMEGYAAVSTVPTATYNRWTGQNALGTTYPVSHTMPDVKVWTPRLPFIATASITSKTATVFGASTVTVTGYNPGLNFLQDKTVYIPAGNGQGQWRKITGNTAAADTVITVASAWTPLPTNGSTIELWFTSHAVSTISGTALVKTGVTGNLPSVYANKWLLMLSGSQIGASRRIVTTNLANDITLETAFTANPVAGDTFVIYDGAATVDTVGTYTSADGAWRDLAFTYDVRPAYSDGFGYPNFKSWPRVSPLLHLVGGATFNAMVECAWQLHSMHDEPIYCIHLGIGAAMMSPYYGTLGLDDFSWFNDAIHNDWHPSSTSDLFSILTATVMSQAALALGSDTMDLRGVFGLEGETDANDVDRSALMETNMRLIRDGLRQYAEDNNLTTLSAERIPFTLGLIRTTSNRWAYATTANTAFQQLTADDPYMGVVDTDDASVLVSDSAHYDTTGQILIGQRMAQKWQTIISREADATTIESDRQNLSTLRTLIKRRYERQGVSNDSTDPQVDMFLNDALREVYNTLGSNAWFLRRKEALTTTSNIQPATFTLPRSMKELLYLEGSNDPGRKLVFKGVSRTDQGRQEIMLLSIPNGELWAHFMTQPRDLSEATDVVLLPNDYTELAVVLTCKRLAEAGGNAMVAGYYGAEIQRLWKYVKRDCLRKTRMYQESLVTVDSYDSWSNSSTSAGFREA